MLIIELCLDNSLDTPRTRFLSVYCAREQEHAPTLDKPPFAGFMDRLCRIQDPTVLHILPTSGADERSNRSFGSVQANSKEF
jgi:hypothetical protein